MNSTETESDMVSVIEDTAAEWIVKLDSDDVTEADMQALKLWVTQNKAHAGALYRLNKLYGDNRIAQILLEIQHEQTQPSVVKPFYKWSGMVAVCSVLLLLLVNFQPADKNPLYYSTKLGEQLVQTLADGSVLHLNSQTRLLVQYTDDSRNIVLLAGEANFAVHKNKDRPFRVYAGQGRVEAKGTEFIVNLRDTDIDVLVSEGIVAVTQSISPKAETELADQMTDNLAELESGYSRELSLVKLGQKAILHGFNQISANATEIELIADIGLPEINRLGAWKQGLLVFDGDSLAKVVQQINKYSDKQLVIADKSLNQLKVVARFQLNDIESAITSLEVNFELSFKQQGDQILIFRKNSTL